MLIGSVIQHHFSDHTDSAAMSLFQERLKVAEGAVGGVNIGVA